MAGEFDGMVAVVTGAASGIGAAVADRLAAAGARVAVLDRDVRGPDVAAAGGDPTRLVLRADVTDDRAVRAAVDGGVQELRPRR